VWADRYGPAILGLLAFAVALWAQTDALVGVFYDDGIYVALAKALAEGRGYVSIHLPDQPAAVHYPPLYPFVLSLLWRLWPSFPANVALFELFDSAALGVAAWVLARHATRVPLSPALRYPALFAGIVAFPILTLVGVRFSEPLFLALVGGALVIADRERARVASGLAAGTLAGLATLTRSIGIAAVVGVSVALWMRGRKAAAVVAGAAGVLIAMPWALWTMRHAPAIDPLLAANYGTYTQFAGQAGLTGILAGLDLQALQAFPRLLLPYLPAPLWYLLAAMLFAVLGLGVWRTARSVPALFSTLLPYVGIVLLWPFTPDRFMWILLPWVALLVVAGCRWLWDRKRWGRLAVALVAIVLAAGFGRVQVVSMAQRGFAVTAVQSSAPFRYLIAGIDTGLPVDATVATDGEALVYLYTGRQTVPLILFRLSGREFAYFDADTTAAYFCERAVTHVGTSWVGGEALPLIAGMQAMGDSVLTPLFTLTDGPGLYRFRCPD
jgi:hypothetical protein